MSALTFYMHDGPKTFRFELAGALAGVDVAGLDQAFRAAVVAAMVAGILAFPATVSADDSGAVLERYSAGLAERSLDTGAGGGDPAVVGGKTGVSVLDGSGRFVRAE